MARVFSLNTTAIPTLVNVIHALPSGQVYDHGKQSSGGTVTLPEARELDASDLRKVEIQGKKLFTEA